MEITVAILIVPSSVPIICERVEMRFLRAGEIISRKNAINQRKSDFFFTISIFRVAGVVLEVAARCYSKTYN